MKEALYYRSFGKSSAKCLLCPHECTIAEGKTGICRVRENIEGKLYTNTYEMISSLAIDPIEKKPLRKMKPGTFILSVGTWGCNFRCSFCQNYHISQTLPPLRHVPVDELLNISDSLNESIGIAFTYNEPTIWYEYILEVAMKNKKDTVLVTNGYINPEPLMQLLPYIDAMNIDLKSMNPEFYRKTCGGSLSHVQETIKIASSETHVELTFLAIPGFNDSKEEAELLTTWIAGINPDIPLHIIPFRPMYKMNYVPYEEMGKVSELKLIARKKLNHVF